MAGFANATNRLLQQAFSGKIAFYSSILASSGNVPGKVILTLAEMGGPSANWRMTHPCIYGTNLVS